MFDRPMVVRGRQQGTIAATATSPSFDVGSSWFSPLRQCGADARRSDGWLLALAFGVEATGLAALAVRFRSRSKPERAQL
jgi:hypothetical protein